MDEATLNDLLECSVCLDRLDSNSKVLPCQHTFCRKCLQDIVRSHRELRCPECRVLVNMRVEELPPNVLLMRILGGLKSPGDAPTKNNYATPPTNIPPVRPSIDPKSPAPQLCQSKPENAQSPHPPPQQIILPRPPPVAVAGGAPLPHKHLPQNVCHAKALFDFHSNITGDLAFKKGDVIVLRRRIDQNWFYGHLNGREGAFPVNHVQIIVPLPVPQCRATFDFRMGPNEEEGCLSFAKGQIINVIRRVDHNWAEGRIGECIGIFPINFVEMNSLAKQLMGSSSSENKSTGDSSSASSPHSPMASNEGTGEVQKLPPMPLKMEANRNGGNQQQQHLNHPVVKRTPMNSNTNLQVIIPNPNRHSAEILNPIITSGGGQSSAAANAIESNRKSMPSSDNRLLTTYVAVFAYKPQKPDELELKKGAHYFVTERCQDGWLRGMNSARRAGVFPGNHVIPLNDLPSSGGNTLVEPLTPSPQRPVPSVVPQTPPTPQSVPSTPPSLPPRNQASVWSTYSDIFGRKSSDGNASAPAMTTSNTETMQSPAEGAVTTTPVATEKKDSLNLIKRLTINLKRSKTEESHLAEIENSPGPSNTTTKASPHSAHVLQSAHGRSGSCPSQLLDFSGLKIANNAQRHAQPTKQDDSKLVATHRPLAIAFGSQRVRGQKERPALHNLHRQLGERKEDLTALSPRPSSHRKSNSLDAGRIISSEEGASGTKSSRGSGGGTSGQSQPIKEKFRCIVPYPPNSEYELGLNVGDIVLVNRKRENGWYRGTHQRTGKSGLFPASFVEPVV